MVLGSFLSRSVTVDGITMPYTVYVAPDLPANPPAILFLHGMGESGTDGELQTKVGIGPAIQANPERWPFLIVMPQKPDAHVLWPGYVPQLEAVLEAVEKEFHPSARQRYLTGLSQGGNGTLTLAQELRWKFAAIAPVCGWEDPHRAMLMAREIPTWLFHGDQDEAVPASCSQAIYDWAHPRGGEVKLTIYPGVGHNSWDAAYAEELPAWFLSHGGAK